MGTKVQANAFLREYQSAIDVDGSTRNGMRSLYNTKNGENSDSLASCSPEKVRQIILEQESIFRNQLQELHRLYGKQQELMSEIKKREINKGDMKKESSLFSHTLPEDKSVLFFPNHQDTASLRSCQPRLSKTTIFPARNYDFRIPSAVHSSNLEKYMQERFPTFSGVESTSRNRNDRDTKLSLSSVQTTSQHKDDTLTFDSYFKRTNHPEASSMANSKVGISERVSANASSNFNLVTKDFFQNSLHGMNGGSSGSIQGLRNGRSENEHLSGNYAEKRRVDFVGDIGKPSPPVFPQSIFAEPRKEVLNCPLDMGTSLSRKKKKIFGVDISEGNDLTLDVASNVSSSSDPKIRPHQENHLSPSLWTTNPFLQNLELCGKDVIVGKNDVYSKSKTSNQERFGLSFAKATYQCTESDSEKHFKNSDDTNQMNPKGGLPWFLKIPSQANGDLNKEKNKSPYFMNLDSLQNCSFFRKAEISDGIVQKQKNEINEVNDGVSSKRILGIPISDMLKSFENLSPGKNLSEVNCSAIGGDSTGKVDVLHNKGLNNYIADLKHQIDLNLSLDEEDVATSAPYLPPAIVKIATTEIDLEPPAVIESENDTPPKEAGSRGLSSFEECDETAANAIIALSLSGDKISADRLKRFAEIISSEFGDNDHEESIPDGLDYFEFTTLKLEDTKGEDYHYAPFVPNNMSDDEARIKSSKISRRGNSRRGRQRKDFQRDILPGLITLSRFEVSEDFQAFEGLMKADCPNRSGRVRKRLGGRKTSPETKLLCLEPPQQQQPVCQLEERGLTGWGKRTRRVPRQRCHNAASVLSFPVRC